jgi:hypothetical protein
MSSLDGSAARGPVPARRGVLAVVAAGIEGFLLDPVEPAEAPEPPATLPPRCVVAVSGLARRCGTTVVARALAAELAGRDPAGTAVVASGVAGAAIPLATAAAGRLADSLGDVPGATAVAVGRLCLVEGADPPALADFARHSAPLVLDAGTGALEHRAIALADRVVLVTTTATEPSLTRVAAACVRKLGPEPVIALNRAASRDVVPEPALALPESRMGAQLALGGRLARGDLGRAIAGLADRC